MNATLPTNVKRGSDSSLSLEIDFIRVLRYVVLTLFLISPCYADSAPKDDAGKIVFKGKVLIAGTAHNDLVYAEDAFITIIVDGRGVDTESTDFTRKYGMFKEELEFDEQYIINISKKGYETKSFEFSTKGADPAVKYSFYADIILKKEGEADDYSEERPVIHVAYEDDGDGFVLVD